MITDLKAITALLDEEIINDYECKYTIESVGNSTFDIKFEQDRFEFNDLTICVEKINQEDPEFSDFAVCVYEDVFEGFCATNYTVRELWKCLLWK